MKRAYTTVWGTLVLLAACNESSAPPGDVLESRGSGSNVTVTNLVTPGGERSRADGINARGQIVGQIISGLGTPHPNYRGVVWEKGRAEDLGVPSGYTFGIPEAINSSGTVVGWAREQGSEDGAHAFLWRHGLGRDLGMLSGDVYSIAHAINAAGDVVGVSTLGRLLTEHAVLWHKGKILGLGTLPGDIASEAIGIDAAGRVFGYSMRSVERVIGVHSSGIAASWPN